MKSKSLLLLAVAVSLCTFSFAQDFHIGLKGGVNLYKIEGKSFREQFDYGYHAGIFSEIDFDKHWGIQPELLWSQAQTRTTSDFQTIYHPTAGELMDVKLNYLTLPILLTYRPVKVLAFQAGPQFGILINKEHDLLHNGQNAFKTGDISLLGGLQLNLGGLKVGGRYAIGVTNINNLDNRDPWRNHGFQLYAGFRII